MGGTSSQPFHVPDINSRWHDDYFAKMPDMTGRNIAITGTTSGTGFVAARDMAAKGAARVILLNRPSDRARKAQEEIRAAAAGGASVQHVDCDLQDFASVREAARTVLAILNGDGLDVLCNNAGAMLQRLT
jgi:NAD(P)-dependent dehydrogenase (short-subunit alcohol dehydrogenase family)